jgi:hypothetical protein
MLKKQVSPTLRLLLAQKVPHPYLNDTHKTLFVKVLSKPTNQDNPAICSSTMCRCL